eukprot:evm.model.scf_65.3 EVM.evm.TU.scf_65.3   scf_65:16208-23375(-)
MPGRKGDQAHGARSVHTSMGTSPTPSTATTDLSRPRSSSSTPEVGGASVKHSMCLKRVKGEGLVFVREGVSRRRDGPTWSLFCLCDGHKGTAAAQYVKTHMWSVLGPLLPRGRLPEDYGKDFRRFSLKVSTAIAEAFVEIGEQFAAHYAKKNIFSVEINLRFDPTRIRPLTCKVIVPAAGLRVLMGSHGLWDMICWGDAAEVLRAANVRTAASEIVNAAVAESGGTYKDDTTALVLDVVAPAEDVAATSGKEHVFQKTGAAAEERANGCCRNFAAFLCNYSDSATAEQWDVGCGRLLVLSKVDGLELVRASVDEEDSRLSNLACSCLPWDTSNRVSVSSIMGHQDWAPAFLTAQRATLAGTPTCGMWSPVPQAAPRPAARPSFYLPSCFTADFSSCFLSTGQD